MWLMFFVGFVLGVISMWIWALLVAAGRADDLEEQWRQQ